MRGGKGLGRTPREALDLPCFCLHIAYQAEYLDKTKERQLLFMCVEFLLFPDTLISYHIGYNSILMGKLYIHTYIYIKAFKNYLFGCSGS